MEGKAKEATETTIIAYQMDLADKYGVSDLLFLRIVCNRFGNTLDKKI